ncbi:MAG: crotonase/enoyl-CoA hydratase family protein [Xanthobacteraceae bacterium]|nr:crotonase/enoyl-CoA hydratase family protein [Xanthobacteraceae bacterium]
MSVRIEHMDFVTTVIIDRVDARNAVDEPTAEALMQAFVAFETNPNARAAVLWGAGGTFCAGYDLKYASTLAEPETFRREFADKLPFPSEGTHVRGPMGPTRLGLSKPVIAAVEGASVAGGMELALWCDLRVMAEDAFFGVYCRRWGIPLIDGGTVRLPRLVGLGRAMDLILTGRKVTAEESLRIGLCDRVVARGTARTAAEDLAREIARFPQAALKADRQSAYESLGLDLRTAMIREWTSGIESFATEGAAGAVRFAQGRGRSGDFANI